METLHILQVVKLTPQKMAVKDVTISDWRKEGWGNITYDQGFALSSNIAVANIVESVITKG